MMVARNPRGKAAPVNTHLLLVLLLLSACTAPSAPSPGVADSATADAPDTVDPGDADLLRLLNDATGCKTLCKKDAPCFIQCGPPPKDELWTPPCPTKVKRFSDGGQIDDYCWDPPKKWCAGGGGAAETPACSPDGSVCCNFATTCIPCGWQECAGGDTCQGPNGPMHHSDPGFYDNCPHPHPGWQIGNCVICEDTLLCPEPPPKDAAP